MHYKIWCKSFLGITAIIISVIFCLSYIVDPIGIWGSPAVEGLNNYKEKQQHFLEVYKPFELRRYQPDNIYIGTSRVYVGWEAEENSYNLGMNSLSLSDMRDYLHYTYKYHVPKRVYIGLDLFQFSKKYIERHGKGFSKERLEKLNKGGLYLIDEMLSVSMGMWEQITPTVKASRKHKGDKPIFTRGFCALRGETNVINSKEYYSNLNSYYKSYTEWEYAPESIICLQTILQEAEDNGVEVYLFFNPVAIDILALQDLCEVKDNYREIKRKIADIHPVYDFAWTNVMTTDREKYWLDGSHYHSKVGEILKNSINSSMDMDICKLLTRDNVNKSLLEEDKSYANWKIRHLEYLNELEQVAPKPIKEGRLVKYLDF